MTAAEREVIEAAKGIARFVPASSWVQKSPARRATTRLNKALRVLREERKSPSPTENTGGGNR